MSEPLDTTRGDYDFNVAQDKTSVSVDGTTVMTLQGRGLRITVAFDTREPTYLRYQIWQDDEFKELGNVNVNPWNDHDIAAKKKATAS